MTYRLHVIAALATLLLLIWFSSGTLAPYAVTTPNPLILPPCHYAFNGDHYHFLATFLMLDGAPADQWNFSVVLRRILYPLLAYPWMKLFGFESGGFIFNLIFHSAAFVLFSRFLKIVAGEKASIMALWLLATYPGTLYWAGMPYSYASIVPCSLLLTILVWQVAHETRIKQLSLLFLGIGVLLTAYDLFPFYGTSAILYLFLSQRWKQIPLCTSLMMLPQGVVLLWLSLVKKQAIINDNTHAYSLIVKSWLHPQWNTWWPILWRAPRTFWQVFLDSNYTFIPLFLIVLISFFYFSKRFKLHPIEKAVLISGLAIFLFSNLAPPYSGWQLRGEWIARIYQPLIAIYILIIARTLARINELKPGLQWTIFGLFTFTVGQNVWIGIGPILKHSEMASYYHHAFYRHAGPTTMTETLYHLGRRRPMGFCSKTPDKH